MSTNDLVGAGNTIVVLRWHDHQEVPLPKLLDVTEGLAPFFAERLQRPRNPAKEAMPFPGAIDQPLAFLTREHMDSRFVEASRHEIANGSIHGISVVDDTDHRIPREKWRVNPVLIHGDLRNSSLDVYFRLFQCVSGWRPSYQVQAAFP